MYAEVFQTDDGYELIVWESEEIAQDDDGSRAILRRDYKDKQCAIICAAVWNSKKEGV